MLAIALSCTLVLGGCTGSAGAQSADLPASSAARPTSLTTSPPPAQASTSEAAGTDVAIASAGVILASDDPRSVLSVIQLSRAGYRKMRQNLWWAAGYNLISVPLAAGVLAPVGFVLPMEVGALLMSLSTIVVALNAQLLRRLDLTPAASIAETRGATTKRSPARR